MTETVLQAVLSDGQEPVAASRGALETFAEGALVTGRWARGLAVAVGLLVLVAVGLNAVRVSSFVVTGLVTIVITGLLARRWRSQWRRDGSTARLGLVVILAFLMVFGRMHSRNLLPLGSTSDMVHNVSSARFIREHQRPLRSGDSEAVALPDLAAYPVVGQYLTAYSAWLTHIDTGRAAELIGFGGLAAVLWFSWAAASNIIAIALRGWRPRSPPWVTGAVALVAPAAILAIPQFGVETMTHYFFQAQVMGMAAIAYALFLLTLEGAGRAVPTGELVLASALVTYGYVQYALVVPLAFAVLRATRWYAKRADVKVLSTLVALAAMGALIGAYLLPRGSSNGNNLALEGVIATPSIRAFGGPVVLLGAASATLLALVMVGAFLFRHSGQWARGGPALVAVFGVIVASLGQLLFLVFVDSSISPTRIHTSRYYRIKAVFPALPAFAVLIALGVAAAAVVVSRLWPKRARVTVSALALLAAVAPLAVATGARSYGRQQPGYDPDTYEAARWAAGHLPEQQVDSLETGLKGYMYTVGELGRLGGTTSALRFSGSYPVEIWLSDIHRRYLVTSDLRRLNRQLAPQLSAPLRVVHQVGRAAVVDRSGKPWYQARLQFLDRPRRVGDGFVARVRATNTGVAAWPRKPKGDQGGMRLGAKVLRGDGSQVVETRSPISSEPSLSTAAGSAVDLSISVPNPGSGHFTLVIDMVWEFVRWFNPDLSKQLEIPLSVP